MIGVSSPPRRGLAAIAIASFTVFAALTAYAANDTHASWDVQLFARLYSGEAGRAPGGATGSSSALLRDLVSLVLALDSFVLVYAVVAVVAVVLVARHETRTAVFLVAANAIGLAEPVLKPIVGQHSPFPAPGEYGYPSGHAMLAMAAVSSAVIVLWGWRWRTAVLIAGAVWVLATGAAAVSDGGHWPSDVAGGWSLALGWVCAVAWIMTSTKARAPEELVP